MKPWKKSLELRVELRLSKSRFISSLRGSREIKTPPTSTSSTSYAAIAAFATAAVGMMDDLVDNEEKNHQVSQLALESTVENLKVWQKKLSYHFYGEANSMKAIIFFEKIRNMEKLTSNAYYLYWPFVLQKFLIFILNVGNNFVQGIIQQLRGLNFLPPLSFWHTINCSRDKAWMLWHPPYLLLSTGLLNDPYLVNSIILATVFRKTKRILYTVRNVGDGAAEPLSIWEKSIRESVV